MRGRAIDAHADAVGVDRESESLEISLMHPTSIRGFRVTHALQSTGIASRHIQYRNQQDEAANLSFPAHLKLSYSSNLVSS